MTLIWTVPEQPSRKNRCAWPKMFHVSNSYRLKTLHVGVTADSVIHLFLQFF